MHSPGTYQGQWLRGMRHGYGVRSSAPFGMASHNRLAENRMASMTSLNQVSLGQISKQICHWGLEVSILAFYSDGSC